MKKYRKGNRMIEDENNNMIKLRKMELTDLSVFKKWLYTPHVARWYHDPLDWINEIEEQDSAFCWIHHFIVEHEGKPWLLYTSRCV